MAISRPDRCSSLPPSGTPWPSQSHGRQGWLVAMVIIVFMATHNSVSAFPAIITFRGGVLQSEVTFYYHCSDNFAHTRAQLTVALHPIPSSQHSYHSLNPPHNIPVLVSCDRHSRNCVVLHASIVGLQLHALLTMQQMECQTFHCELNHRR